METNYVFNDNKSAKRYELKEESHIAFIDYVLAHGKIFFIHTEVPKELGGRGIGSMLVRLALEDIERRDLTLVPLCPFVATYIEKHPEWRRVVIKE